MIENIGGNKGLFHAIGKTLVSVIESGDSHTAAPAAEHEEEIGPNDHDHNAVGEIGVAMAHRHALNFLEQHSNVHPSVKAAMEVAISNHMSAARRFGANGKYAHEDHVEIAKDFHRDTLMDHHNEVKAKLGL